MTSPPGSPDSLNDMSAVSTFIKNSEALLHPSSPPTGYTQHSAYNRTRIPSESELALNYDQRRHTSMPSIAAAAAMDKREAIFNANMYQRSRSASLSTDRCSILPSSPPNPCQSPPSFPLAQQQQGRTAQRAMSKPALFNIKTELPENLSSPTAWRNGALSNGNSYDENFFPTAQYQREANLCKTQVNGQLPPQNGACSPLNNGFVVSKQEKFFAVDAQYDPNVFNRQTMEREHSLSAGVPQFFPHQVNFSSIPDSTETESVSNPLLSPHLHQHQQVSSIIESRLRSGDLCQRRHHPYLRMAANTNFPMAVNGTTPYRPRFNRRSNPDLEKKRIHKCTYAGKSLRVYD